MDTPSPKLLGFRITANPRSDVWEAPVATSEYSVILVGWITDEVPIEAGVPPEAARVLSECLTRLAVVTFLGEPAGAVLTRPGRHFSRRSRLPLVTTQDPGVAQELFRSASYDWSQQAQIALLSEPGRHPQLDYENVAQCLDRSSIAQALRDLHLLGILYPAVDGDFAALVSSDAGFLDGFERELRSVCEAARVSFASISEEEFRRTEWSG